MTASSYKVESEQSEPSKGPAWQQMEDSDLTTLQDVACAAPGLYGKTQGVSDQESTYFARGFALSHVSVETRLDKGWRSRFAVTHIDASSSNCA